MASIRKRGDRYLVTWRAGGRGTPQQYRSFPTLEEAEAFKEDLELPGPERYLRALAEMAGGEPMRFVPAPPLRKPFVLLDPKTGRPPVAARGAPRAIPTLFEYAYQLCSSPDLASGTVRGYRTSIAHLGGLGALRVTNAELTTRAIRDWWNQLNLTRGARGNVHTMLSKVLRQAADDGLVAPNLLRRSGVRPPSRAREKEIRPLDPTQIDALATACTKPMYRLAVLLGGYGGLRAGEVGGLRVQDFEPATCHVQIRQATFRNGGDSGVKEPKTEGSKRKVRLPRQLCLELARYVSITEPASDGRIFYTPGLGTVDHILLTRTVKAAAKRAGLPPVNFHMLRHTAVALLIQAGVHPKIIQRFCGHRQLATTMDVYGHLFPSSDDEIGSAMERAWESVEGSETEAVAAAEPS